ncbi:glucosamine-6-phosphate deaminase [Paenibacillus sp. GD4]|uniref:glucosamine-6-phosphate deaminase n=1 Tax=Paenibacillus sp. GD4 TaxID=3068890 RepID=UPI002796A9EB|nr:glucosamine-6-phosphate deaminase [Paenibacillus sp. GD4]MDQ1909620.1 glucosamine-6-phosphate deaminase [Paenibacillus sp. GD4]
MQIHICRTAEELNDTGASIVADLVRSHPRAVLGLATGGTPVGIYEELVRRYAQGQLSFRGVTTFNLDEYVGLAAEHPQSYRYYMEHHLFRHIDVSPDRIHIPSGSAPDPEQECDRYDALLEDAGRIDLQLLGVGHNGHIGFNEPGSELVGKTHVVELAENTRKANARFFSNEAEVPTHALTMGVGGILQAKTILLIAKGADKAEIVHRSLCGPITTDCPASLLQTHANLVVLLDSEAGRLMRDVAGTHTHS